MNPAHKDYCMNRDIVILNEPIWIAEILECVCGHRQWLDQSPERGTALIQLLNQRAAELVTVAEGKSLFWLGEAVGRDDRFVTLAVVHSAMRPERGKSFIRHTGVAATVDRTDPVSLAEAADCFGSPIDIGNDLVMAGYAMCRDARKLLKKMQERLNDDNKN